MKLNRITSFKDFKWSFNLFANKYSFKFQYNVLIFYKFYLILLNIQPSGNDKSIIDTTPKFSTTLDPHYNQHAHASQFLNTHMHSQIAATSGAETTGHLHRTREVENIAELEPNESVDIETESDEDIILKKATATAAAASASATETTTTTTTIKEPPVGDDLIEAGLEMLHGKGAHLKRTHEVENLNEMSQDD